jgi:serine/threonine protein kinase
MSTILSNYKPSCAFEHFFKNYLETIECCDPDYIIESIYRQVYNDSDSPEIISAKFSKINSIINNLLSAHYNSADSLIHFKNDIDLVFVFSGITIKIFNLDKIKMYQHDKLYSLLLKNECSCLETIYRAFPIESDNLFVLVTKTVNTNFKYTVSIQADIIRSNVDVALKYLKSNGWNHRDVSIDNLGYDHEKKCFTLFDFGAAKFNSEYIEVDFISDYSSLERSIKFHSK